MHAAPAAAGGTTAAVGPEPSLAGDGSLARCHSRQDTCVLRQGASFESQPDQMYISTETCVWFLWERGDACTSTTSSKMRVRSKYPPLLVGLHRCLSHSAFVPPKTRCLCSRPEQRAQAASSSLAARRLPCQRPTASSQQTQVVRRGMRRRLVGLLFYALGVSPSTSTPVAARARRAQRCLGVPY